MEELIEKFMNNDFIVTHNVSNDIHKVTSYCRNEGKTLNTYETNDERYAHLRFIQSVMIFIS